MVQLLGGPARIGALTVVALIAAAACSAPGDRPAGPGTGQDVTPVHQAGAAAVVGKVAPPPKDVADPVRLRIPAIGVSARMTPLRLDAKGRLKAPGSFVQVGWHKAGPEPGEKGVAVIAGHVDSVTGPAVFYRLRELRKGDRVHVDRSDGSTVTFTVTRLARYPKERVPDREVYHGGGRPEVRLITCGGSFDHVRRSYRDNVVVFAG